MVKNTKGGSGHKKFGRKFATASTTSKKYLRVSVNECELYAIVTKMLGNGMFQCVCIDGVQRIGHIRGKFSGRKKHDNIVSVGKWVLIGLREWENTNARQQCDLLDIYTDSDKQELRETETTRKWKILDSNDVSRDLTRESADKDGFVFGTDQDFERQKLEEEMKSNTLKKINMTTTGSTITTGSTTGSTTGTMPIIQEVQEENEIDFNDI